MWRQRIVWLSGLVFAAAWLDSCGAMSFEPNTPDEPVVASVRPPRLVRRDGGGKAEEPADAATGPAD